MFNQNIAYIKKSIQVISVQPNELLQIENTYVTTTWIKKSNITSIRQNPSLLPLDNCILYHPKVIYILSCFVFQIY